MAEKQCTKCGIVKPLEAFYRAKHGAKGRASYCKKSHATNARRTFRVRVSSSSSASSSL